MLKVIGGEQEGEFKAVASGTLPNGKPVVVNSDGTVSAVAGVIGGVPSETVFESAGTANFAGAFDSNANSVVILYKDEGNSNYPTVIVGAISGTSISFGTPVVISSHTTYGTYGCGAVVFDSSNNKVAIGYYGGPSSLFMGVVGTVSGTSISLGSITQLVGKRPDYISGAFDSANNKVVFAYRDNADTSDGYALVCTISGTSISAGSNVVFDAGGGSQGIIEINAVYDSNAGKIVICYRDNFNDDCYGIVGTVSGTSISFGSKTSFADYGYRISAVFDSTNNKIVTAYMGLSGALVAVGTVSGTSISFGTSVAITAVNTQHIRLIFDTLENKPIVFYRIYPDTEVKGSYLNVSGTSVSVDTPFTLSVDLGLSQGDVVYVWDSTANKTAIAFSDRSNSSYGTGGVVVIPSTNLTAENYIGMSRGVVDGQSQVVGTSTVFETDVTNNISSVYDANSQKVVIAYRDNSTNYGTAIVGTVSGTSITFGSAVVFESGNTSSISAAYDSASQKVVISYTDDSNSSYGTAIVGTVSGTSISFGSPVVFNSTNTTNAISSTFDSNSGKVVISYRDYGNGPYYGTAIVGTVSGNSISFGTSVVFNSANTPTTSIVYDSTSQKVVVAYQNSGNSGYAEAIVGTVSGTSISFGSSVVIASVSVQATVATYDSNAQKVVVAYTDNDNSASGTAVVGTVSGTSISFGTPVVFDDTGTVNATSIAFDSSANAVVIAYRDYGNSQYGTFVTGTVSGTSITFGTPTVFEAATTDSTSVVYDSTEQKTIINYGNTNDGISVVVQVGYENRYPVADGNPAILDIIGSVSTNQLSLTAGEKYYVQTDGTISTTAGDPSVLAGTAISATKLVVKT